MVHQLNLTWWLWVVKLTSPMGTVTMALQVGLSLRTILLVTKRGGCHLVMATIGMTILACQVGLWLRMIIQTFSHPRLLRGCISTKHKSLGKTLPAGFIDGAWCNLSSTGMKALAIHCLSGRSQTLASWDVLFWFVVEICGDSIPLRFVSQSYLVSEGARNA